MTNGFVALLFQMLRLFFKKIMKRGERGVRMERFTMGRRWSVIFEIEGLQEEQEI